MNQWKIYCLLSLMLFFVASCKKDKIEAPRDDEFELPEGVELNNYINAINKPGERKFQLTVNSESLDEDQIKGNYSLVGDDEWTNRITEGKLILFRDNEQFKEGKLLLVTKVHKIEPHARKKASFDATQVAMNFLFQKGDFNYSGFPNRTKLAASGNEVIPGLFYSANSPVLLNFLVEAENENYKITSSADKSLSLIINEIELFDKDGANVKLQDVALKINPTFDILCQFEPMTEVERNSYFEAMKDNGLITNMLVVKDLMLSKAKKLGVISYTDLDFSWETVLNYKASDRTEGKPKKLFKMTRILQVGPIPVGITLKGSLRYEYTSNLDANITLNNEVKLDLIAGGLYDFQTKKSEKIGHVSLNNSTSSSQLLAVSAQGKIYYDQEVEIKVLGLIGPTFKLSPGIGAEIYYHQETGKPLYQNFGVYATAEVDYAVKLKTFFWQDISVKTSEVHLGEHEFGRNYIYKLPAAISAIDGDKQSGPALSPLLKPIKVKVTDSKGNPLAGISVEFLPQSGGSVDDKIVITDKEGLASTIWSPGYPSDKQAKLVARLTYHFVNYSNAFEYLTAEFIATVSQPQAIDPGGYTYKTIKIGKQLWLAENYRYLGFRWHDEAYGSFYGEKDYVAKTYPKNWRLPTAKEYQDLLNSLGERAFEVLTAQGGFNARPFGFIAEQDSGFINPEFNKKAIYITSDRYGKADGAGSGVKALHIDFNTKQVYIANTPRLSIGAEAPSFEHFHNARLIRNE